jgi:hypothetical protein
MSEPNKQRKVEGCINRARIFRLPGTAAIAARLVIGKEVLRLESDVIGAITLYVSDKVVITLDEQPDKSWKVVGLTVVSRSSGGGSGP